MTEPTIGELAIEAERHGVVHYEGWTLSYGGSVDLSEHSIFELEPGCPSYLIPKAAAEQRAHHQALLERINASQRWTWCWTHGLIRGRHDCTTTEED